MRLKLALVCTCCLLNANENGSLFEFLAKKIDINEQNITAIDDVVVINRDYLIRADYGFYDLNSTFLELKGGVEAIKGGYLHSKTEHLKANINQKSASLEPFYLQDNTNNLWIASKKADLNSSMYIFKDSALSSCSLNNPVWHIEVTEGNYDTDSMWVNAWNPTFYFQKVPIFYLPYFGFSADQKRRSGLLSPTFGISQDEGLIYHQPIYYAQQKNWDFEFIPQIRSKRGRGAYGIFRYADTKDSMLTLKSGYFLEDGIYKDKYNLRFGSHYGFNVNYKNNLFFSSLFDVKLKDAIYVDGEYLSDIDYLNLQKGVQTGFEDKISRSKLNYATWNDSSYLGLYMRYFIDTSKISNDSTLQEYPSIEYHRYFDTIFVDNLYYSLNMQNKNYLRKDGLEARVNELRVPIGISYPFFDDYLRVSFSQNLNLATINYYKLNYLPKGSESEAKFFRTFYRFELFSELVKPYSDFFHALKVGTEYIKPAIKSNSGYFADFIDLPEEKEEVALFFKQSFNTNKDSSLYHKLKQGIALSEYKDKYGELVNEIGYRLDKNFEISSKIFYLHDKNRLNEASNSIGYEDDLYELFLSYYQNRRKSENSADFGIFSIDKKEPNYTLFANIGYDFDDGYTRFWSVGLKDVKRCFGYKLGIKKEIVPILNQRGSSFKEEHSIFLEIAFIPIGNLKHKLFSSKRGNI